MATHIHNSNREIPLEPPSHPRAWEWASYAVLAGTLVLLALLVWVPDPTLRWTWNVVVPILPATFMLTPALWRNVCPLATLNELPQRFARVDRIPTGWVASGIIAIVLLFLLVPARRALFNTGPEATAAAVAALAVVAVGLGLAFAARSGFCNSVCPILPVERLYGQHPLLELRGSRCASCTFCTPTGCMDLARDKAMVQVLGHARHSPRWLLTPMGMFGAAFPGLVFAYFTTSDMTGAIALDPWVRGLGYAAISFVLVSAVVLTTRLKGSAGMTLLAALAFGLYYWFAAEGVSSELGLGSIGRDAIRAAAGALLVWWLWRARARVLPSQAEPV